MSFIAVSHTCVRSSIVLGLVMYFKLACYASDSAYIVLGLVMYFKLVCYAFPLSY